jgi:D-tyrosyl-tRNA(Tyr) deacylase
MKRLLRLKISSVFIGVHPWLMPFGSGLSGSALTGMAKRGSIDFFDNIDYWTVQKSQEKCYCNEPAHAEHGESLMKAVIQRVSSASVEVEGKTVGEIRRGILVLLGVEKGDAERDADWLAEKIFNLRIFEDEAGKMNLSVRDVHGGILAVSQFTLAGSCGKGRRPSFDTAAPPLEANALYEYFAAKVREFGVPVETGVFQANMQVRLTNDGPVTFILESPKKAGSAL